MSFVDIKVMFHLEDILTRRGEWNILKYTSKQINSVFA